MRVVMQSKNDGRSVIKPTQIKVLVALYKYRFGSRQLLAELLDANPDTMYRKLLVLIKHGLVAMRLEKRSKLYGIPAAYYLTPKGLKFLQTLPDYSYIDDAIIKSSYRDKSVSESTVLHSLAVFKQILALKRQYPPLKAFLRREIARFHYFPSTSPNAFLSLSNDSATNRYFFDYIPSSLERKAFYQRVSAYIDFFDKGGWDATNTELPVLLYVAENASTEHRIKRLVKGAVSQADSDIDLTILTTTKRAIEQSDGQTLIWTDVNDPDELIAMM